MRRALMLAVLLTLAGGCKKPAATVAPVTTAATTPTVTGVAEAVPGNTNYAPGAGTAHNVANAARRTLLLAQMSGLGLMIETEYTLNGKMPDTTAITTGLEAATAQAIKDGRIVLCWTGEHQGLWAYEGGADKQGGIVLVTGVARRAEADEVTKLLGK